MNVLPFPVKVRKPEIPSVPKYHCLKCDGISFQIIGTGDIFCTGCSARMSNLTAEPTVRPA